MMKSGMSQGSALPKLDLDKARERMLRYKTFAEGFSYPGKEELSLEYDRLFRGLGVWLYGSEYTAENEFQRARSLADINGFYRAWGLEPDAERPDSISCELEFMHYLIFKEINAPDKEKSKLSLDAQKKFFCEHLYPAAKKIIEKVLLLAEDGFYKRISQDLLQFLKTEKGYFDKFK